MKCFIYILDEREKGMFSGINRYIAALGTLQTALYGIWYDGSTVHIAAQSVKLEACLDGIGLVGSFTSKLPKP